MLTCSQPVNDLVLAMDAWSETILNCWDVMWLWVGPSRFRLCIAVSVPRRRVRAGAETKLGTRMMLAVARTWAERRRRMDMVGVVTSEEYAETLIG